MKSLTFGPLRKDWTGSEPKGDCSHCGGQCDGNDCGLHASGCIYGGFTTDTSYWMYSDKCPLYHGDEKKRINPGE